MSTVWSTSGTALIRSSIALAAPWPELQRWQRDHDAEAPVLILGVVTTATDGNIAVVAVAAHAPSRRTCACCSTSPDSDISRQRAVAGQEPSQYCAETLLVGGTRGVSGQLSTLNKKNFIRLAPRNSKFNGHGETNIRKRAGGFIRRRCHPCATFSSSCSPSSRTSPASPS
jgi:hypothetical protein